MRAEILTIGTELLLGQIVNTNANYLAAELSKLGINCHYQTTVGDNAERIKGALDIAFQRADIVVTTGGLGPTPDDLTHETIAEFFQKRMTLDTAVLETIQEFFAKRNRNMAPSNKKQAMRPDGADLLPNPAGTAPGIIWSLSEFFAEPKYILTFPGVPFELKAMWEETARPFLANLSDNYILSRELKIYGIGESALAERVSDLLNSENPTIAPLAGKDECRLRITARADNRESALIKIKEAELKIRQYVGEYIYGVDNERLEEVVGRLLTERGETIALAESCTGGLISQRLTSVPGSSAYTHLNLTTYSNESKAKMLKVSEPDLEQYGAVSEQIARQMAIGAQELANTDYGVGVTGIAGPASDDSDKSVGLVYISLYKCKDNTTIVKKLELGDRGREHIRWMTSQEVLNLIRLELL